MPSLAKRVRRRFTLFLLVFSCIQLPEQPPPTSQYRLATEEPTWNGGSDPQLLSSLLSPQFIGYGLVLLGLLVLGLLATVDLVFKTVFIVCSLAVHCATSHCRIQRPPQKLENFEDRSPSRVSVRIHGVGEGGSSYLLPAFPCQLECGTIYSRVSHLLGVPSALLTLSTGVKVLRRRVPLQTYTSDLDLSNGLTLYCCISLPGGGGRPTISELHRLSIPEIVGPRYHMFGLLLLNDETGLIVETVIKREIHDPERIVMDILIRWLRTSEDATWNYLTKVLRDCRLNVLADEIQAKITGDDSSLLAEAMKEGEVVVPVIKVILVGTAGVGKTCVYSLLMGVPPPDKRDSTECAKRPVRVVQIISGEEKWEKADLKEMLAEAVPILCKRLRKNAQKKESTDTDDIEGETGAKAADKSPDVPKTEGPKHKKSPLEIVIENIVGELDELVARYKGQPMKQLSLEKQAIYLSDSGGQQAFWDLVPIFMRGPLTVLFVHRLCDNLGDKPLNEWYKDGKPVGPEGQRATLTTAEVFKLMCQGLESGGKSNIIVIGTHKDVYDKSKKKPKETIKYKNEQFESCIPQDSKVYVTEAMDMVIFEVNTTQTVDENKVIAGELRKVIVQSTPLAKREIVDKENKREEDTEESTGNELEPIPISWYVLQIVLEEAAKRLKRQVFLVSECETVAKELSFGAEEVKAALRFFDKLNIFFYKERILPDVVFISSQVPLTCVTELVKKRHSLLEANERQGCNPTVGMWKDFRDKAKITLGHLEEIFKPNEEQGSNPILGTWRQFRDKDSKHKYLKEIFKPKAGGHDPVLVEGKFTEKTLLHLLKGLLIVASINKSEYFCPALLKTVEVDGFLKRDDLVTRVIHFPSGFAPPGVFCCAVCHLGSIRGWEITETPEEDVVARNKVIFKVEGIRVTFVDKFQFFSISIAKENAVKEFCRHINSVLYDAIEHALETTHKEATLYGLSFLCPCSKYPDTPHPAKVGRIFKTNLVCTKNGPNSTLSEEQKIWHNLECSGCKSEPTPIELSNKVVPRVCGKIRQLAIQLGLGDKIEAIQANFSKVEDQTLEVFKVWRERDENYTWGFLIEALKSPAMQLIKLANELEDWLHNKS